MIRKLSPRYLGDVANKSLAFVAWFLPLQAGFDLEARPRLWKAPSPSGAVPDAPFVGVLHVGKNRLPKTGSL
jgi:hypothetical protein